MHFVSAQSQVTLIIWQARHFFISDIFQKIYFYSKWSKVVQENNLSTEYIDGKKEVEF